MQSVTFDHLPTDKLQGVGAAQAQKLAAAGILTWLDIALHLPLRYENRAVVTPINQLDDGSYTTVEGQLIACQSSGYRSSQASGGYRRHLTCQIQDDSGGEMTMRLFYFSSHQKYFLEQGCHEQGYIRCYGKVQMQGNKYQMIHPEYRQYASLQEVPVITHLTPVYRQIKDITPGNWRNYMSQVLAKLSANTVKELLPSQLLPANYLPLHAALKLLHLPPLDTDQQTFDLCNQRLALEELLAHRLERRKLREEIRAFTGFAMPAEYPLKQRFTENLPFSLTPSQQQAVNEIACDMASSKPMMRLLQGDVGSGKTVVAAYAILQAVATGAQVAVMSPSEILAVQQAKVFSKWFEPLGIHVVMLLGSTTAAQRQAPLDAVASGLAKVVVGTHALFQKGVHYHNLALVVIDEQHRFGVHQRLALREKAISDGESEPRHPHQLIMTATPIPRTLAMSLYASLDCTTLSEMPSGRKPITTVIVNRRRRDEVIERVAHACRGGGRAFWVCALVEESDKKEYQAAVDAASELSQKLPDMKVGLVHGRMSAADKQKCMQDFTAGQVQILVASTVVEVGVDVPEATLMIIEDPEYFGLAQLHQLRGRVGRGHKQSYCVLMCRDPLSDIAAQRLSVMRGSNDGFSIAEQDMLLRGPGEILGTKQSGSPVLKVANLNRDLNLLHIVNNLSTSLEQDYPWLIAPISERWLANESEFQHA